MEKTVMEDKELSPKQLAERWIKWGMTCSKLAVWRHRRVYLPWNKRGGKITYNLADILAFEEKTKIIPS